MYGYHILQWLLFFYIYCFVGWCFESSYVSIRKKRLINRGFIRGPFLPLYGSGAIMMLLISAPFQDNLILTYFAGVVGATALEFVTGVSMEALFKVRYWDYSNQKLNYKGHICLSSSVFWGFLTIAMTKVIHKPIEQVVLQIPESYLTIVVLLLSIFIAADVTISFLAALDLRDILVRMEKAKEELEKVQKHLDDLISAAEAKREDMVVEIEQRMEGWKDSKVARKQVREYKMEDLYSGIEERFLCLKVLIQEKPTEYLEAFKEEMYELRMKYNLQIEKRTHEISLKSVSNFVKRAMLRGNPTMVSVKFKEALEELKKEATKKK